ncbi:MAG TPA: conjugal transfer protein MobC [Puia sp.]|nr:conjugal transfer protein MobC [Puia sp.]
MSNSTGENEVGLQKILDFTRLCSIMVLLLHFYYFCYDAFADWKLTSTISDRFLLNIANTGLFHRNNAKLIALGLLVVSLVGAKGRKNEKINKMMIFACIGAGTLLYFYSKFVLQMHYNERTLAVIYIITTSTGYLLILTGGAFLSRLIKIKLGADIFNELNESFPQEERLLQNEYSINLPARYQFKGRYRNSWINIINPFRGVIVVGSPGSGKSYFVIRHLIRQHIEKGFCMLVYDFKYPDLTQVAYDALIANPKTYKVLPQFNVINFDDPSRSVRCNPIDPATMHDITDAIESARSILLGLNREWETQQGDFFVESPINFVTAVIWFLKKYEAGKYCTLPHLIELMQVDYEKLFPVLRTEPEIEVLINPFISAYQNDAMEQLEGQVASAKIAMARLSSPLIYWVLSANEISLDINNPEKPQILCLASNPQKQQVLGAVLSLYITRIVRLINQKDKVKCSLIFDEFPTIYFNGIDALIATARSNKVATCLGMQDFSQLRKDYGSELASVIMNIAGNIISGQVTGETAKFLSERFGKITQVKESISVNRNDTSISKSSQMDLAIPPSKIAALSSGEFVGMVADDPEQKIKLKTFHCEILNEAGAPKQNKKENFKNGIVSRIVTTETITEKYQGIKKSVAEIIENEIEVLMNTPGTGY